MKDLREFLIECEERLPKEFVRVSEEVDRNMKSRLSLRSWI